MCVKRVFSFFKAVFLTGLIMLGFTIILVMLLGFIESAQPAGGSLLDGAGEVFAFFFFMFFGVLIMFTCMWSAASTGRAGLLLCIFYLCGAGIALLMGILSFSYTFKTLAPIIRNTFFSHVAMGITLAAFPFAGWYIWATHRAIDERDGPEDWDDAKEVAGQFALLFGICLLPNIALAYAVKKVSWLVIIVNVIATIIPIAIVVINRFRDGSAFSFKKDEVDSNQPYDNKGNTTNQGNNSNNNGNKPTDLPKDTRQTTVFFESSILCQEIQKQIGYVDRIYIHDKFLIGGDTLQMKSDFTYNIHAEKPYIYVDGVFYREYSEPYKDINDRYVKSDMECVQEAIQKEFEKALSAAIKKLQKEYTNFDNNNWHIKCETIGKIK